MNFSYKNVLATAVLVAISAQTLTVFAQTNPLVVTSGRGSTGSVLGAPGTYEVRSYNQVELEKILAQHFGTRQNQDAAFVTSTVKEIDAKIGALSDDLIREGGILAVHRGVGGAGTKPIDLAVYLGMAQEFQNKKLKAETSIKGILLIPSAIKSQQSVTIDNVERIQLPSSLKVDLENIQAWYVEQINQVTAPLEGLQFLLSMPDGSPKVVKGLSFVPTGMQIPASVIAEMQKKVQQDLMRVDGELSQQIRDINIVTMEQLRSSMRAFGTSQVYRMQLNKEGRDRNLQAIAEIYWARDYLRALYGNAAKLGAIGVDYTKQKAHWDFFTASNKMNLIDQPIEAPGRLTEMQDSIAAALATMNTRDKEVFGQGVDMLSRIASGVTFVRGESQLASINVAILLLMKRDIEHEIELQYAGATKRMQKIYQDQYYGAIGSALEKETQRREDDYSSATGISNDPNADLMVTAGSSCDFLCAFRQSEMALKVLVDQSQQARNALAGIEELRKLSGASQIMDQRRSGLRNR